MLDPSSPKRIGDYVVIKNLGSGTTGSVKLARHVRTGEHVALKVIKDSLLMRSSSLFKKSRREIAVLKLLSSLARDLPVPDARPVASRLGVMQLLDVVHLPEAVVLVLEYCNGGELFDALVQQGCLPLDLVLDYLQQLSFALRFCHARGVCHRDLKPENVLLTDDARLKLVDFGMATMHTPGTFLQTSCGSPQYCAPEVLANEPYDGRIADVWSLGVTLYAMTTGGLPFDEDNMHRLIEKIRAASFYIPPEVPDALADLLRAMLTPDPARRITLDGVIASPWFNSHPPRPDIYVELPFAAAAAAAPAKLTDAPVYEPEPHLVRHLVSLGLGDDMTIKRRLRTEAPCREREFYRALANFRPAVPSALPPPPPPPPPVLAHNAAMFSGAVPPPSAPFMTLPLQVPRANAQPMVPTACSPVAHASAVLLQAGAAASLQPELPYEDAVSAVVGRPPPRDLAPGALAVPRASSVPMPGSHILDSMRSLLPTWIGALPREQAAPLATSVGSDGPLSAHVPLS